MQKKLLILMLLFSTISFPLFNNDYIDINHMTYLSSIGISNNEKNEIELYAYIINNYSMGKSEYNANSSSDVGKIIISTGNNIEEVFFSLLKSVNVSIDFSHIETLILHTSFINETNLNELIDYFKFNHKIYPSFYIYLTDSNIEDIYKIDYFNDTSSYYTLLTDHKSDIEHHKTTFLELVNDITINNYFCLYPSITTQRNIIGKEKGNSLLLDGYYYFDNKKINKLLYETDSILYLLYSTNNIIFDIKEKTYNLVSYSIKHVRFLKKYYLLFYSKSTYEEKLKKVVKDYIVSMYQKKIDFFNLNYYQIDIKNLYVISVEKVIKI